MMEFFKSALSKSYALALNRKRILSDDVEFFKSKVMCFLEGLTILSKYAKMKMEWESLCQILI